jgi:hypothetical protein
LCKYHLLPTPLPFDLLVHEHERNIDLRERQGALATFRVLHTMNTDMIVVLIYVLGRDEDVLLTIRSLGGISLDLSCEHIYFVAVGQDPRTIILVLIRRLTASINTSNSSVNGALRLMVE